MTEPLHTMEAAGEKGAFLTTVEQMEADTARLHETACEVCGETWEDRKISQGKICKFGEEGICCKVCSMGPCRITAKAPRGICGANAHTIAGRNYLRMVASGSAAHSDHGREICHTLYHTKAEGPYTIKDSAKLHNLAKEWGIETEGKNVYDLAHEVALEGLSEYGKPFGTLRFLERATEERQNLWEELEIAPRAIDREVTTALHMTHMGNTADAAALVKQSLRTGMADGWGGSMMGTEFTDIMFGTPSEIKTEANLGVVDKEMVNIVVHGHDPAMSEMVVMLADEREMNELARKAGARGINVCGVCCTSNEVALRHGVPMAGNFLQQENILLTGAIEAMVVDVQCIFPAVATLSECFHTKFITTSEIARIPGAQHIRFEPGKAYDQAREIVTTAINNFKNRDESKLFIPKSKQKAYVGYSCETILGKLDGVTNSHIDDELNTYKPLIDCITSGVLRGAVAIVGCNNPKIRPDYSHIEIMKELLKNDIIIVASGCSAQAAGKAGLLDKQAKEICGEGLKRVCELADIPPVLHMGSCVDISRMMLLANNIARDWGVGVAEVPVVGCAPEWMSEKAVAIANYVVATGIDTYLGIDPLVSGSSQMMELITDGTRELTGAGYHINTDPHELVQAMIDGIEAKRAALGMN